MIIAYTYTHATLACTDIKVVKVSFNHANCSGCDWNGAVQNIVQGGIALSWGCHNKQ